MTGANEYFSGFANIGHNPAMDLLFLWIIPKCDALSPLPPSRRAREFLSFLAC